MDSLLCRAFQKVSLVVKTRAVAGAVPCPLIGIPCQFAAKMGADNVHLIELSLLGLIYTYFILRCLNNRAVVPVQSVRPPRRGCGRSALSDP